MSTIRLTIDSIPVEVEKGQTLLEAARKAGIEIPTMCFLEGFEPSTSCMVCVVEIERRQDLVPACGYPASEGMVVLTSTPRVREARRTALELLLSDHLGDCMGPCQVACPAKMDIPLMIRLIERGDLAGAVRVVREDIPLPAVLGRICPAPCEKVCRRKNADQAVSICLLKRYVGDVYLQSDAPFTPDCAPKRGKSVAIVGAGPAGLSAGYYLARKGIDCTIYDKNSHAGGMLRYGVEPEKLPQEILDREIEAILSAGITFKPGTEIGKEVTVKELQDRFDAVFLASGWQGGDGALIEGLESKDGKLAVDIRTYRTSIDGIFAGGDLVRKRKLAVRSTADGKEAAEAICQYLAGEEVTGPVKRFNSRMGMLGSGDLEKMMQAVNSDGRFEAGTAGFTPEQASEEAQRCLHCDCRKPNECKLRQYSEIYDVSTSKFKGERPGYEIAYDHPEIVYEPGKCIRCGLCIQTASKYGEEFGLTFKGRGFDVKVAAPFGRDLQKALGKSAGECVKNCPTGALAYK